MFELYPDSPESSMCETFTTCEPRYLLDVLTAWQCGVEENLEMLDKLIDEIGLLQMDWQEVDEEEEEEEEEEKEVGGEGVVVVLEEGEEENWQLVDLEEEEEEEEEEKDWQLVDLEEERRRGREEERKKRMR